MAEQLKRHPFQLLQEGRYREALQEAIRLLREGAATLPWEEGSIDIEEGIRKLLDVYVEHLRQEAVRALSRLETQVERSPEEVLKEIEQWRARIEDRALLPPWRRPTDLLPRFEALKQAALRWLEKKQKAEALFSQAEQETHPAKKWMYFRQAREVYPHLSPEIDLRLQEIEAAWLQALRQAYREAQSAGQRDEWERAFRVVEEALQDLPDERDLPEDIRTEIERLKALREQIVPKRQAHAYFQAILRELETLLEHPPTPAGLQKARYWLRQIPEPYRDHAQAQWMERRVEAWAQDLEALQALEAALEQGDERAVQERLPLLPDAFQEPWRPLAHAFLAMAQAHRAWEGGMFDLAVDHLLEALHLLSPLSPQAHPLVSSLRARARNELRRWWSRTPEEHWQAWLQVGRKRLEHDLEAWQRQPDALRRRRLAQTLETLEQLTARVPEHLQEEWQALRAEALQAIGRYERHVPSLVKSLHQHLQNLEQAVRHNEYDAALRLLQEAQATLQQLQQYLPFSSDLLHEREEHLLARLRQQAEEAELAFSHLIQALKRGDSEALRESLQTFFAGVESLFPLAQERKLQEIMQRDASLGWRLHFLHEAAEALGQIQDSLHTLSPSQVRRTLQEHLRHAAGNPLIAALLEALREPKSLPGRKFSLPAFRLKWPRFPREYLWVVTALLLLLGVFWAFARWGASSSGSSSPTPTPTEPPFSYMMSLLTPTMASSVIPTPTPTPTVTPTLTPTFTPAPTPTPIPMSLAVAPTFLDVPQGCRSEGLILRWFTLPRLEVVLPATCRLEVPPTSTPSGNGEKQAFYSYQPQEEVRLRCGAGAEALFLSVQVRSPSSQAWMTVRGEVRVVPMQAGEGAVPTPTLSPAFLTLRWHPLMAWKEGRKTLALVFLPVRGAGEGLLELRPKQEVPFRVVLVEVAHPERARYELARGRLQVLAPPPAGWFPEALKHEQPAPTPAGFDLQETFVLSAAGIRSSAWLEGPDAAYRVCCLAQEEGINHVYVLVQRPQGWVVWLQAVSGQIHPDMYNTLKNARLCSERR